MESEEPTDEQINALHDAFGIEGEALTKEELIARWPHQHTGTVRNILFNIDKPLPFKLQDIQLNKLTLMTGMNGTGKSFIMASVWAMTMVAQSYIIAKMLGQQMVDYTQYIFDRTFRNQDINGIVKVIFESGCTVRVIFKEGKVQKVECLNFEHINIPQKAHFMSADMRTFSDMNPYLQLRKMLKASKPYPEAFDGLTKTYRLYDVMYMEDLIGKMPIKIPADITAQLKEKFDFKEDITDICLSEDETTFYAKTSEGDKVLSIMGKGPQSILNMMVGQLPGTPKQTPTGVIKA